MIEEFDDRVFCHVAPRSFNRTLAQLLYKTILSSRLPFVIGSVVEQTDDLDLWLLIATPLNPTGSRTRFRPVIEEQEGEFVLKLRVK
jgi:hypothetical protein